MDAFAYTSYKDFLKSFIEKNASRGFISQIAQACGCDRTYISQVLNGKAHFTPDHIIQFCEHFRIPKAESEYLLLLLLRDRSALLGAKKSLEERIKEIRSDGIALSSKVATKEKTKEISEEMRTLYYSSWIYSAIHILTSIPEFQVPAAIAQKLQLSLSGVHEVLRSLVEMSLVKKEKGRFLHSGGDIYLRRTNPQSFSHHLSWRMRAVERAFEKDDIHYTVAFSVSKGDVELLRSQMIELIERQRKIVRSSGTEVACAFCIDFFKL